MSFSLDAFIHYAVSDWALIHTRVGCISVADRGTRNFWRTVRCGLFLVVTSAEVILEPNIQTDKQVSAPHLAELQIRLARSTVSPSDRNNFPSVTADDSL